MQHTFKINTAQLGSKFIESVKSMFSNRNVKIVVEEIDVIDKNINTSEVTRFLDHRKSHPSVKISGQGDFNQIVDEVNL
ncbi:hypothetical protein [Dyadobacter arcticus]|uniref:Uncharacterized protein n=1 Tax=Dyadobacter arcticus TaxID=1078754 RepID=A0ABX0UEK6_9BACT|nr:hypothetical protein [Dyadobacter arcticus]NIJ50968.1 hypothetical protein [Dyadobacter arcticus]